MSEAAEPKSSALHVERSPAQLAERPGFLVRQFRDKVHIVQSDTDAQRAKEEPQRKTDARHRFSADESESAENTAATSSRA